VKWFRRNAAIKTEPDVSSERVLMELSSRYSPIRNLTPSVLSTYLDCWGVGELKAFALLAEKIIERDDKLASLDSKRRKAVSALEWDIVSFDDSPDAKRQKETLEAFFGALTATSAVDESEVGGINLLIRQMLKAVSMRWSVQEIVWAPRPDGLTATFRDVPLWYFEHRTAALRYLPADGAYNGEPLAPGEWLVSRGEGLAIPCSILYLFKHMPMRDWLIYCQRYVVPGLHAQTTAAKGSREWDSLVSAMRSFSMDWALVTNEGAKINPIDVSARGELPYPKLIERCDRAMAILYRGADLSTMSAGDGEGSGASLQQDEQDLLLKDDVAMVEETIERQIVPFVLRYALGVEKPLVRFVLERPTRDARKLELETDGKLIEWGCPVGVADLLERYNRSMPDPKEALARPPATGMLPNARAESLADALSGNRPAAARALGDRVDARLQAAAREAMAAAVADDLAPLRTRIEAALANESDEAMIDSLKAMQAEMPNMLLEICRAPKAERVLEESLTAALLNGVAEGAAARAPAAGKEGK
jgi:phage gp29-like protein